MVCLKRKQTNKKLHTEIHNRDQCRARFLLRGGRRKIPFILFNDDVICNLPKSLS
jgi:hypothetical protein